MTETIRPLEETDPALAEQFRLIANGKHPTVKAIIDYKGQTHIIPKKIKVGRNDPCPWCANEGIHIKYKKCKRHQGFGEH